MTKIEAQTKVLLGKGELTWPRGERVSDRYGLVFLFNVETGSHIPFNKKTIEKNRGTKGSLIAVVTETRQSNHIGDIFRGIGPVTPDVGEEIELGRDGELYFESVEGIDCIGLRQNREIDWLDPVKLYRAHEQTVELYFISEHARASFKGTNEMTNRRMAEKIDRGEAISLHGCDRTLEGDYIVPPNLWRDGDGTDYCDRDSEQWIWSIGRHHVTGQIVASTGTKYYENPDYECLFLR